MSIKRYEFSSNQCCCAGCRMFDCEEGQYMDHADFVKYQEKIMDTIDKIKAFTWGDTMRAMIKQHIKRIDEEFEVEKPEYRH